MMKSTTQSMKESFDMAYKKSSAKKADRKEGFDPQREQILEMQKRVEEKCLSEGLSPWKWYLKHARVRPMNWATKVPFKGTNALICGMLGISATLTENQLTRIKDRMVGLPSDYATDDYCEKNKTSYRECDIIRHKRYKEWETETGKKLPKPRLYPTLDAEGNQVIGKYGKPEMHYAPKIPIIFCVLKDLKDKEGNPVLDKDGNVKKDWLRLLHWEFDVAEIENLTKEVEEVIDDEFLENLKAEDVANDYIEREGISLVHSELTDASCYSPSMDRIMMSQKAEYISADYYYQTLFHEMGHSTGHKSRLNRNGITKEGMSTKDVYAEEELVAEFCAVFSMADLKIEGTFDNDCAYIKSWWDNLKRDPKKFARACNAGFKAKEYIFGKKIQGEVA